MPKGHVWLEGDNALNSTDSRTFGSVPAGLIRGRAVCRLWPLSDVGRLDSMQKWQIERWYCFGSLLGPTHPPCHQPPAHHHTWWETPLLGSHVQCVSTTLFAHYPCHVLLPVDAGSAFIQTSEMSCLGLPYNSDWLIPLSFLCTRQGLNFFISSI